MSLHSILEICFVVLSETTILDPKHSPLNVQALNCKQPTLFSSINIYIASFTIVRPKAWDRGQQTRLELPCALRSRQPLHFCIWLHGRNSLSVSSPTSLAYKSRDANWVQNNECSVTLGPCMWGTVSVQHDTHNKRTRVSYRQKLMHAIARLKMRGASTFCCPWNFLNCYIWVANILDYEFKNSKCLDKLSLVSAWLSAQALTLVQSLGTACLCCIFMIMLRVWHITQGGNIPKILNVSQTNLAY